MVQVETMIKNTNTIETEQRMALDCYNDGVEYGKKSSDSYKQAGEHFAYLKSHIKHGEYKKWLEENNVKYRTAHYIVEVYERFSSKSADVGTFEKLSFSQLKELLYLREGEESEFIEFVKNNQKDLSALSVRELRSLVKDYNSITRGVQGVSAKIKSAPIKSLEEDIIILESKKKELEKKIRELEERVQRFEDDIDLQDIMDETYNNSEYFAAWIDNDSPIDGMRNLLNHAYTWEQVRRYLSVTRKIILPEEPPEELKTILNTQP